MQHREEEKERYRKRRSNDIKDEENWIRKKSK